MEQELKLNWLAAGQIFIGNDLVAFDRVPHMAVTYTDLILLAGARDHGVIAVDARNGGLAFIHDQDRGDTCGVLVDRSRVFVVTTHSIKQYCLSDGRLEPMAIVATLDDEDDGFCFANGMTIDTHSQVIYARISDGQRYKICAYGYYHNSRCELYIGTENCLEAITHIFERAGVIYGVQGCVGAVYNINDITAAVGNVQGSLCSVSASSDCFVTSQRGGQSVTLWTPDFKANSQYQIGLLEMFKEGQQAAVLLHRGRLITFHAEHALLHLFEWRRGEEQPSEALQSIFDHPKHARIDRTVCRYMGVAEVLSSNEIVQMMLNLDTDEELIALDTPPAKVARTITTDDGFEVVDPTYFKFLDIEDTLAHFSRCVDDDEELDYIGAFALPEISAL